MNGPGRFLEDWEKPNQRVALFIQYILYFFGSQECKIYPLHPIAFLGLGRLLVVFLLAAGGLLGGKSVGKTRARTRSDPFTFRTLSITVVG